MVRKLQILRYFLFWVALHSGLVYNLRPCFKLPQNEVISSFLVGCSSFTLAVIFENFLTACISYQFMRWRIKDREESFSCLDFEESNIWMWQFSIKPPQTHIFQLWRKLGPLKLPLLALFISEKLKAIHHNKAPVFRLSSQAAQWK